MQLAGIPIPNADVVVLATLVDEPTRGVLEKALRFGTKVVALTIAGRERILWALHEAPDGALAQPRGVLLREHEWRVHEGLS